MDNMEDKQIKEPPMDTGEPAHENDIAAQNQSLVEHRMATENLKKLVFFYSLPSIIGMLLNALYNVVDRFWVGRIPDIGTAALTGIGLCMPIMNILLGFSQLLGIGATACISIALGRKDKKGAEQFLATDLFWIVAINIFFTTCGLLFARPILLMIGAEESADMNTLVHALDYIRIIFAGSIFNMVSFAMNHPIRGMGNPRRFASTQLLGAVCNIVLDPIFIFTFGLGIKGAAYATVISQAVSAIWVFSYYMKPECALRIRWQYIRPNPSIVKKIVAIGLSPFLIQVMSSVTGIVVNRSLMHYGNLELGNGSIAIGAFTVINSLTVFCVMPILGINQGVQPIIGFNYGAKNYQRTKEAFKWSAIYATIICIAGWLLVLFFPRQLVQLFNSNEQLVEVGAQGLRYCLITLPLVGFTIPASNMFQAIDRANVAIFLSMLRQAILLIPAYFILPQFLGLFGIWLALPITDIISMIVTAFFLKREFNRLDAMKGTVPA